MTDPAPPPASTGRAGTSLEKLTHWSIRFAGYDRAAGSRQWYVRCLASDPDGLYGPFAGCTPGEHHGQFGRHAEAEPPTPGDGPSFTAYAREVADTLHQRLPG